MKDVCLAQFCETTVVELSDPDYTSSDQVCQLQHLQLLDIRRPGCRFIKVMYSVGTRLTQLDLEACTLNVQLLCKCCHKSVYPTLISRSHCPWFPLICRRSMQQVCVLFWKPAAVQACQNSPALTCIAAEVWTITSCSPCWEKRSQSSYSHWAVGCQVAHVGLGTEGNTPHWINSHTKMTINNYVTLSCYMYICIVVELNGHEMMEITNYHLTLDRVLTHTGPQLLQYADLHTHHSLQNKIRSDISHTILSHSSQFRKLTYISCCSEYLGKLALIGCYTYKVGQGVSLIDIMLYTFSCIIIIIPEPVQF